MKNIYIIFGVLVLCMFSLLFNSCTSPKDIPTAKNIDLNRYMGKWFEIARFENYFQKGKTDAVAEYTMLSDGTVKIVNTAKNIDGSSSSAKAIAYVPDLRDSSKLRVSFFWPFYADYWILDVSENYDWALVGSSDDSYLWILARQNTLPQATLEKILAKAKSLNYDTSLLIFD